MRIQLVKLENKHVQDLLKIIPQIDPHTCRPEMHESLFCELIRGSAEECSNFSTYSRVLVAGDRTVGHISGRLISASRAKEVLARKEIAAFTDASFQGRQSDKELREANRAEGSTLVVNSIFWDSRFLSKWDEFLIVRDTISQMIRWFEGNFVTGFAALARNEFQWLLEPLRTASRGTCTLTPFEDDYVTLEIVGPWPGSGFFLSWGDRLLTEQPDYSSTDLTTIKQRLTGRVLYEFKFDVAAASMAGLIPSWTYTEKPGGRQESFPAFGRWRTDVGNRLGLWDESDKVRTAKLRKVFAKNPSLLTP